MSGVVLAHPAAPVGGSIWLGGQRVVDLPTPPQRPVLLVEAFPALVETVGADAACTLVQLLARCEYDPTLGWVVQGSLDSVKTWNLWGRTRARLSLQELVSCGAVAREQQLIMSPGGRAARGPGLLRLCATQAPAPSSVTTIPVGVNPSVETSRVGLPARAPGEGLWGVPLAVEEIRALLGAWGFDGADAAITEYGTVTVSDAVKATAYRVLKGGTRNPVGNPGGYVRGILTNRDIATPPAGLDPEWLTGDVDLVALVPSVDPAQALASARASLDARAASVQRRWQSLPNETRAALDAEWEALATTLVMLSGAERQRREVDLREGLLAEQGLLAELPADD